MTVNSFIFAITGVFTWWIKNSMPCSPTDFQKLQCADEVIAAGILNDIIEDTPVTFEKLAEHFGQRVAELVLAASEKDRRFVDYESE